MTEQSAAAQTRKRPVTSNQCSDTKFIRMSAVMRRYDVPRSTLYGWIDEGKFPPGIYLGGGQQVSSRRWSVAELDAYDAACAAAVNK